MRIANRLSLGPIAVFGIIAVACQMPLEQLAWHVGTGALMLVICFALFACLILLHAGGDLVPGNGKGPWFIKPAGFSKQPSNG